MSAPTEPKGLRILAYGIEKKGLPIPKREIAADKYAIEFADYNNAARFQDFDGVIIFQGTFESFTLANDGYSRGFLKHKWDRDELDKRTKEALALLDKGGFACLMLTDPFVDFDDGRDYRDTDLSKRLLSLFEVDREEFGTRIATVKSKTNELGKFFEIYGAAWSFFESTLRKHVEQSNSVSWTPNCFDGDQRQSVCSPNVNPETHTGSGRRVLHNPRRRCRNPLGTPQRGSSRMGGRIPFSRRGDDNRNESQAIQ